MRFVESGTCELKRCYTPQIVKEVVAFLNGRGGTIFIGVDDEGSPVGVEDPDKEALRVSNAIRDAIKPDAAPFASCEVHVVDGVTLLALQVNEGSRKPYYIASKGLRPEGVYRREGTSAAPVSEAGIRMMIKESDGDSYERRRALNQNLTFAEADRVFANHGIGWGDAQKRTLGVLLEDGLYSNLGLLLSDQCPHIIKAARFDGTADAFSFRDRAEFTGSVFKQVTDAYAYLDMRNGVRSAFAGLERIDSRDYPDEALREALINCVVHRAYDVSAPVLIKMYDNQVEFLNFGGLMAGMGIEEVLQGVSYQRNSRLAHIFYRLSLIEAYGTGVRKMFNAYRFDDMEPCVTCTDSVFRVVLPNRNEARAARQGAATESDGVPEGDGISVSPLPASRTGAGRPCARNAVKRVGVRNGRGERQTHYVMASFKRDEIERTVRFIELHEAVTRKEIQEFLGVGQTKAGVMLRELVERGVIRQVGAGPATRYRAA